MPTTTPTSIEHPTADPPPDRGRIPAWAETAATVAGALVIAFLVQQFVVKPYKVPTPSMMPTIHEGQRILASRIGNRLGDPKDGQVLVFHPPAGAETMSPCGAAHAVDLPCLRAHTGQMGKTYVKRVVGVPGDRLRIAGGHVIRNGYPVQEPEGRSCGGPSCNLRTFTVPADTYFMMGDNRGNSLDSRFWGPLPRKLIIGRAFATYWPPSRIGGL